MTDPETGTSDTAAHDHDSPPAPFTAAEAAQVRKFWRDLGLPGIIDVHTHFMPRRVMDKVWAYFDSVGPMIGREWPITYRADEDVRVSALQAFGVRVYSSMIYPHKADMAEWLNGWGADFAAHHPDCLHTSTFYPEPDAASYVSKAIERGTRVFKSHIQVGDYSPLDPSLTSVWAQIADVGVPVVIHCGSGPTPGRFTGPEPIAALLRQFPSLPLIVAHMGTPEYEAFLDLADTYENVRLDTTMSFTDFSEEGAPFPVELRPRLLDLGDKILFGSDYPNIPYPYAEGLDALVRLDLGDDWLRRVFYENAASLFGVGA
ncbi:amidohydrolase [Gordonia sp. 852002-50816_SCH5313054-c]|uniref:amidohydrolase family protein n=1 Tax=unclassified Gordonia (in: high G+C Gram-positive bacteria) TaxID=2657482 RepID=UPI0007EAF1EE|nr:MULTISPECIES: amidohydrolase family protein [unclassified Gordonia (in: high G+C Gram-positive bacteria)]OBC16957.1 amidohydrolase [Gordonia sp. 852002-50816_SCH5313054-a]OBC19567.1 amidohydrolase [Gordonia sp. 852002-50816_SCH5313054-c]